MNNTSEALLAAVDIVVNEALTKLEYDKTVSAEVWSIVNLDTGEYKVRYSGNIFSAFANDVKKQYKVGDNVYVTIPEGNFSNKKIIAGKVSEQSLSYGQMMSLSNSIIEVSPTLDHMYNYDASAERGVVAGAPLDSELSYEVIYQGSESGYHGLFQLYSKLYELIRILGSFLTTFHCEHTQGNYGIEVQFFTKSGDTVAYRLDLNSFNGDPYSLSVYSPQSVVIKALLGYLTGVKLIKLFEENFVYDNYVESGLVTDKLNTTVPNIFVKDVAILFVEQKDLTDNLYYLDISAPQGNSFTANITSLDLVARLIYQGDNILSESTCLCLWYERDLSVMIGSDSYDKNAGVGWKAIESSAFGTINLTPQDVVHQKQYKLVVIYNDTVVMSAETTIYNLLSEYDFTINQITIGDALLLLIVNNADDDLLLGDWYLTYPDGSYSFIASKENIISVTDYLLYSAVTFYCGVYNKAGTDIIGVLEYTITSSESEDDITISYSGEDSFRYDANGDIAIEDSEKERTLLVILAWKDGVGTSYRVEWLGPDGENITNTRYTPNQSMIENLWVDNSSILHYTIKLKYKVNYNNNTITVKIITVDGKEYEFKKEILFLKDGDLGTNGTTYITAIRPYDTATGLKLSGLTPLIYSNGQWQNSLYLRCYVYTDGELINDNSNYVLTYKWTGVNVDLVNTADGDKVVINGQSAIITNLASPYVKAQVTINDRMNNRTYDIYCSYPIDVAVGFTKSEVNLINIDDIPSYIKYTASGVNPSFYSNNIVFTYNGLDYTPNINSLTVDVLAIEQKEGLYYLKPASSFIFEDNTMALLKCTYTQNKYLYHPIILYLDTYGNEAINGWDGTKIDVNEEGGYILAPQIGAGTKDSANRFTGVVMGQDSEQDKIGLYGYQNGVNTFGLMQNGIAYFGAKSGGGQITIDGTTAKIYGGGTNPAGSGKTQIGGDATNGMTITLADLSTSGTTDAIKIGGGVFKVTYNGALTATSADVTGQIYALSGKIGSTSKTSSDGWTITTNRLYSGSGSTYVELNTLAATNTTTPTNNNDFAFWAGSTTATSAKFSVSKNGIITAKLGTIGGWTLTTRMLSSNSNKIGLASSGTYRFWSGADGNTDSSAEPTFNGSTYFWVNNSGEMSCRNATVRGTIYADKGTIGDWTLANGRLQNSDGSIYLSTTGLRVGDNFSVSSSGKIVASAGSIGGWTINSSYLGAGSTRLYSSGRIVCEDASITGDITADTLTCYEGTIGGWRISSNALTSSNGATILSSSGTIWVDSLNAYLVNIRSLSGTNWGNTIYGYVGMIEGMDDNGTTYNIGLQSIGSSTSIILASSRNIAFRGTHLYINMSSINCSVPAESQTGIYARFA